ncbi:SigE family RNA polymerase sigma factor [Nocardioides sp.]|uniref:SigE family RNA polymerase sigma factor n=1 Tax=Nocardioides sp. TaxID=35761 RepID=UPI002732B334|nr:SigE family RNA polymerase sigma factor [Nocardioides sp.]MDP3894661.1 SigE family RNA polymerase sigma factor [Nocardioides sp.]
MFGGSGADDEFDTFAVAAWPRLRWSAYLLTGDHHLAEDLAQTALARTYGAWGRVRRNDAVAYSRKVLVHLNIDRMRRRRVTEVGDQALAYEAAAERGDAVADRDEVQRLLARLTDKERRVVVLRHYFDLSELDVAAELEIAPGTVKSTLSRALAKMRVAAAAYETTKG